MLVLLLASVLVVTSVLGGEAETKRATCDWGRGSFMNYTIKLHKKLIIISGKKITKLIHQLLASTKSARLEGTEVAGATEVGAQAPYKELWVTRPMIECSVASSSPVSTSVVWTGPRCPGSMQQSRAQRTRSAAGGSRPRSQCRGGDKTRPGRLSMQAAVDDE